MNGSRFSIHSTRLSIPTPRSQIHKDFSIYSLIGDANAVISSLELSDANYNVAWSILSDMTTSALFKLTSRIAIMDLLAMAKENSIDFRRISDGAAKHLHPLQALKCPTTQWDDLVFILTPNLTHSRVRNFLNGQRATVA